MKSIFYFVISLLMLSCGQKAKKTENQSVTIITELKKLATGFAFTEGPAADADGHVFFSDIPEDKIYKWTLQDSLELYRENSNASNGLYFDHKQNLWACEGGISQISLTTASGDYSIVASEYESKPFNTTNDIWPDAKGGAYFTDPRYGGNLDSLPQGGMHVFYVSPDLSTVTKVCDDLTRPNGIIGTPDGKTLYISDRGAGQTFKYTIQNTGFLTDKTIFVNEGSDGMTIDQDGNIYLTTKDKSVVDIFSPSGQLLKTIDVPEAPTNVTFGGKERNQLYITAQTSLYRVELNKKGVDPSQQ